MNLNDYLDRNLGPGPTYLSRKHTVSTGTDFKSLLARDGLVREQGVAGSNPATPTNKISCLAPICRAKFSATTRFATRNGRTCLSVDDVDKRGLAAIDYTLVLKRGNRSITFVSDTAAVSQRHLSLL
jgi:hypothetical protein